MMFHLPAQFWGIPTAVANFTGTVTTGTDTSNLYLVTLQPPNSSIRKVAAFLEPRRWDHTPKNCLYAGNSQGGRLREVQDPNDSLIEGDITDYQMPSAFATSFRFRQFNESSCSV